MKKNIIMLFLISLFLTGCSSNENEINIAGSSTVHPITAEAIYSYIQDNDEVIISLESTGTGGGFELFTKGETDINNASRAIKEEEANDAKENNIEYYELYLGTDGITVIVNKENDWIENITKDDLKKIFEPNSKIEYWSDLDPSYPNEKINIYGPTSASGTYDFFCEEIIQEEGQDGCSITSNMNSTENDNETISNISKDKYGIGFLGYAYYEENQEEVKALSLDEIEPTIENIKMGKYELSRPLYIYVNKESYQNKESVNDFVNFYLNGADKFVSNAGYVPLTKKEYDIEKEKLK